MHCLDTYLMVLGYHAKSLAFSVLCVLNWLCSLLRSQAMTPGSPADVRLYCAQVELKPVHVQVATPSAIM